MASINEITPNEISQLLDVQLVKLLKKLLYLEAYSNGINNYYSRVPLIINVGDEGEDGNIEWQDSVESTNWLPTNKVCFQVKATGMGPKACYKEVLNKKGNQLKPQIQEIFDKGGAYVLFCSKRIRSKKENIKEIRKALRKVRRRDYKTAIIKVYDNEDISTWVNTFSQSIRYVYEAIGKYNNVHFKTWEKFSKNPPEFEEEAFVANDFLLKIKDNIRSCLIQEGKIFRLLGLSGLGKSRLIYEAFNEEELSRLFLYYDSNDSNAEIISNIQSIVDVGKSAFLVIDNCDMKLHNKLKREIIGSKVTIITLDNDPTELPDDPYWLITPKELEDIIEPLLKALFQNALDESQIGRIKDFAQGFPLMAVLLAGDVKIGKPFLGEINDNEIIKKLTGVDNFDNDDIRVLQACSIFENLGYFDELEVQRNAVAKCRIISKLSGEDEIIEQKFFEICKKFLKRGIIDKRGRYIFVKPKPLALRLASDWWQNLRSEKLSEITEFISHNDLSNPLISQLKKLDFLPQAKDIVKKLTDENGPFGLAEVLNTELGSQLFRSLVEVNPEETCKTLEKLYLGKSKDYLFSIKEARRNIVWSLEKLCWRKETFASASKLLYGFALAENEKWGNNATGILLNLVHVKLPGTEASLDERYKLIEYIYEKSTEDYTLTIKVLKSAIQSLHFTRDVGFEYQGSGKPLKDYIPSLEECIDYWRKCLEKLYLIFKSSKNYKTEISNIISESIRNLTYVGAGKLIIPLVEEISKELNYNWPEARSDLKKTLKYDRNYLNDIELNSINNLIELLTPNDFVQRFRIFVSNPGFEEFIDNEDKYTDVWKINSEREAESLMKMGSEWKKYIELFCKGSITQGYDFGSKVGELIPNADIIDFLNLILDKLREIDEKNRNFSVLIGFLNGVDDQVHNYNLIEKISEDENLKGSTFLIASKIKCNDELFEILFKLVDIEGVRINKFLNFKYYRYFDDLSEEFLSKLFKRISAYGSIGSAITYLVVHLYIKFTSRDKKFLNDIMLFLLKDEYLLKELVNIEYPNIYNWSDYIVKKIDSIEDKAIIEHISNQICNYIDSEQYSSSYDNYLQGVLILLFEKYFDIIWPKIADLIIKNNITYLNITYLIGYKISFHDNFAKDIQDNFEKRNGILFKYNNASLISWCKDNSPEGAIRLARMIPIFYDNFRDNWHPFTLKFIDEFGDNKEVLNEISAQMGSYSWTGSTVSLYMKEKALMEKLLEHKFEVVKQWARNSIEYLDGRIKIERRDNQERYLNT